MSCACRIDEETRHVVTVFSDGAEAHAERDCMTQNRGYAELLGYSGDDACWNALVEHELLHSWLWQRLGRPYSEVLWAVAHGVNSGTDERIPYHVQLLEESIVLSFQRYLNTGLVDPPLAPLIGHVEEWAREFRADMMDTLKPDRS